MEEGGWREKLDHFKIPLGLSLIGIMLIVGGIFTSSLQKAKPKEFPKESLIENQKVVSVDVSGAVVSPGVYQLKDGARIEEAITAAGGFNQEVNEEYVSKYLNMAQKVSDGSKVYVPVKGEEGVGGQAGVAAGISVQAKVNVNTASGAELENLSGIGPVTAAKIITTRPYQTIEDLLNKKAVSKAVFEKIKDQIVVY